MCKRSCALGKNRVRAQIQSLQRIVLTANQSQANSDNVINPKESGGEAWEQMFIHKDKLKTYARPAPMPEAPTSPIRLPRNSKPVRDVF